MKTKLAPALAVLSFSFLLSACSVGTAAKKVEPPLPKIESFSQKSTLKNLLGMDKNLTCTYTFEDAENKFQVKGTTYISGKKFAQEGETTDPTDKTKTIKNYMVSDGDYVYTWGELQKGAGMKIKLEEPKDGTPKTDVAGAKGNMDKEYDMNCTHWDVDQARFNIPADIKFTDYSEIMKNLPKAEISPAVDGVPTKKGLPKMPAIPTVPTLPE